MLENIIITIRDNVGLTTLGIIALFALVVCAFALAAWWPTKSRLAHRQAMKEMRYSKWRDDHEIKFCGTCHTDHSKAMGCPKVRQAKFDREHGQI